jgi:uncharacterized protein GlcG (DUF336 family)
MNLTQEITTLSHAGAELLLKSAVTAAEKTGLKISVCILDSSGRMKAFLSMDGAPPVSLEACIKKAKTAVGFGLPTGATWYDFIKNDPILMNGAQHLPDFILLGGGSPITLNGSVVGAIGVSGGHYSQDEKCVQAALEAFASKR